MHVKYILQRLFAAQDYALMLLNRDIQLEADFFVKIWNNASVRQVIDGGANSFFKFVNNQPGQVQASIKYPDLASGDFDSITDESMRLLKESSNQCKIILTEDQDETDFTKGLKVLHNYIHSNATSPKLKSVIVICESSGRLDQVIGNLNTLHKNRFLEDSPHSAQVYMLSSESLCWLLPANQQSAIVFEKDDPGFTCGVIPFVGPTTYSSTGLKWDLTPDMLCNFGGLISTNNIVVERTVEIVSNDKPSVFTVELHPHDYIL
ncbi:Thiamin pyrophosphokinase 1 [Orchesella cincta]|uniref:Thiamin pyrophosphokinase 1 n=1 Tax=Orchesella cincta TaxID=48709 RepID=A0A1D2MFJ6_ORCCI|nr:Thiamin pyrophosphokinase 1 [Orchesella cincta]